MDNIDIKRVVSIRERGVVMVIKTGLYVAFKCDVCDKVQLCNISMFNFFKGDFEIRCTCDESGVSVLNISKEKLRLATYCPSCDVVHVFLLTRKSLIDRDVIVLYCPKHGTELCIIGKDQDMVTDEIDFVERRIESLVDEKLNTKCELINTNVTYESIDKINEIKKKGMLTCWCGNNDIAVYILKDRVVLRCRRCMTRKDIKTVSNRDLVDLKKREEIVLE